MANTVITHQAQKLRIKSMRNSHFKLVVNIKNADGSDYDFTSNTTDSTIADDAYIIISQSTGAPVYLSLATYEQTTGGGGGGALINFINRTVEDGKITIEWDAAAGFPYAPWPGTYKYHIYTVDANDAYIVWLYGDFVVEDQNISQNGVNYNYVPPPEPEPEPEPEEEEEPPPMVP